jgi:hypothetical protein
MDKTTTERLEDLAQELFSLARAHRSVVPPASYTAIVVTDIGRQLREIARALPLDSSQPTP